MLRQFNTKRIAAHYLKTISTSLIIFLLISGTLLFGLHIPEAKAADATLDAPEVTSQECTLEDFQANPTVTEDSTSTVIDDSCLLSLLPLFMGDGNESAGLDQNFVVCLATIAQLMTVLNTPSVTTTPTGSILETATDELPVLPSTDLGSLDLASFAVLLNSLSQCSDLTDYEDLAVSTKCVEPNKFEIAVENKNEAKVGYSWKLSNGTATKGSVKKNNSTTFTVNTAGDDTLRFKYKLGTEKKVMDLTLDTKTCPQPIVEPTKTTENTTPINSANPSASYSEVKTAVMRLPSTSSDSSDLAYAIISVLISIAAGLVVTKRIAV